MIIPHGAVGHGLRLFVEGEVLESVPGMVRGLEAAFRLEQGY
jgi:hypothetical protein